MTADLEKTLKIARMLQDACECIDREGGGAFETDEIRSLIVQKLRGFNLGLVFDPETLSHRLAPLPASVLLAEVA